MSTACVRKPPMDVVLRWAERYAQVHIAMAMASLLSRVRPSAIQQILSILRLGARPSRPDEAESAFHDVHQVAPHLRGPTRCLARSLTVVIVCRFRGHWPTWCVGVRIQPPFVPHAWVEVDRRCIGEVGGAVSYRTMLTVPISDRGQGRYGR